MSFLYRYQSNDTIWMRAIFLLKKSSLIRLQLHLCTKAGGGDASSCCDSRDGGGSDAGVDGCGN